ncbi:PREDICTED: uncharacterized protein LOC104813957 [Tarenaya hassleriana]|uniref:uncharacterized protein LOC104813957 n=1 Tax=Tarenaya hassleriana TaxID=28532 RepID=UPI00053C7C27|nr:PREDICTED: uncharacterized protein LOC104813957 [Tarenaya hassleriana]
MDSIISSALEEICCQGSTGISLSSLWLCLSPPLLPSAKACVWANLLAVPQLQFKAKNTVYGPSDASIQRLEDAEELDLRIVAGEKLRDNFVGLYENTNISTVQRRVLERLAIARTNGVAQNQLAKEFGVEGRNFFYIMKHLESRRLIVRQPAIVRTKELDGEGESKTTSCISTNMIYLSRYAKPLGTQQRFEICRDDFSMETPMKENEATVTGDDQMSEIPREDMLIKDFLPAMEAVCNKLEEAKGKVLVISDIKHDLGYSGSCSKHRAWRSVCRRLKDSHILEEFEAVVNNKVERCLRLLKKFSAKDFESKCVAYGNYSEKKQLKFGRSIQKTDQVVELPLDYQIYDMVDAEGSKGMAVMDVCERLGMDKKKSYPRFYSMFSRAGMHLQVESHKKTTVFRAWTPRNVDPASSELLHNSPENLSREKKLPFLEFGTPRVDAGLDLTPKDYGHSAGDGDLTAPTKLIDSESNSGGPNGSPLDATTGNMLTCHANMEEPLHEIGDKVFDAEIDAPDLVPSEINCLVPVKSPKSKVHQAHPVTVDNARRERRILERLQEEKFILRAELHKWLLNFEKDKCSKVDRKTIDRILAKLQQIGHCKCMAINVPNVTNCGHNRRSMVVLHPSLQSLTPDVIGEIHDRIRSFEMELRGQSLTKGKGNKSVPILNDVQRRQTNVDLDSRASKSEAMRANGFVLAKMVRVKLLHCFLWDYFSSLPGWENALSSINDQKFRNMFALEDAFGAMPLELFLQVVGSTQRSDDMIKKCKQALRLSDLPNEEYKLLMDTLATGRLSKLIDILRRLKLIRLVSSGHRSNEVEEKCANLTHTMELKPYIEEPIFVSATSNVISLDLRPRIRHDFVLSSREAVDEYWLTLEYCYAAADHRAAAQAFPGSVVHEVFLFRSWASVRVMTADQRAELIKRIAKDNAKDKLSFRECEKIAKDLNLTLEQVLRVYHDKCERRFKRRKVILSSKNENALVEYCPSSSSHERKRVRAATPMKAAGGGVKQQGHRKILDSDTVEDSNGDQGFLDSSQEDNMDQELNQQEIAGKKELTKDEEQCSSVIKRTASAKTSVTQLQRYTWTDEADRKLLMKYVRHRAVLGARPHGVDWASVPELPAPIAACKRRMTILKKNENFRKALMNLCNLLSERYAKHLEGKQKSLPSSNHPRVLLRCSCEDKNGNHIGCVANCKDSGCDGERWDDFNETSVRQAFDDVLELKKMAKLVASRQIRPGSREWSNRDITDEKHDGGMVSPATHSKDTQNVAVEQVKDSSQRSGHYRLHQNFKLSNEAVSSDIQVQRSLAISSAVELLKLVFLSMRTAPGMPNLLEDTLRRYSERDLFAAYSYLRDKKYLVGGSGGQPFVLSQSFLHSISKSPFPINTGKRAAKFSNWLLENERDLMAGGVDLTSDLQCGDIFNFFSLVASGELCISVSLPDEGVGECEERRGSKRGTDGREEIGSNSAKKLKLLGEGEINFRKEKGFPGIKVSVRRTTFSTIDAIELFKDDGSRNGELHSNFNEMDIDCNVDDMKEIFNSSDATLIPENLGASPWQAMDRFANCVMAKSTDEEVSLFNPEIFETVSNMLQKAGDQGLSLREVHSLIDIPEKTSECIVDVLLTFGLALKVNGYDCVRVVDSLYRSKYFLTTEGGNFHKRLQQPISVKFLEKDCGEIRASNVTSGCSNSQDEHVITNNVHQVTILNLPEVSRASGLDKESASDPAVSSGTNIDTEVREFSSGELCMPIVPWINADGSINKVVFSGLVRRVLGTVMQNPGITEDEIIYRMDVLNPQNCKKLLELMKLDGHIKVREMLQTKYTGPPSLLASLLPSRPPEKQKLIRQKHFFANPNSLGAL